MRNLLFSALTRHSNFFVGAALHLFGIDAHAELDYLDNIPFIQSCREREKFMVPICSFYVNSAGSNLHSAELCTYLTYRLLIVTYSRLLGAYIA